MRLRTQILKSSTLKLLQIGLGIVSSLILARWLGPAGFGQYSFALAIAGTLAILAQTGWPVVVTREIARAVALETWSTLRGVLAESNRMAMWAATTGVAAALAIAAFVGRGNGEQDAITLALAALAIPMMTYADLRAAALRGLGQVLRGQMLDAIVRPSLLLLLVIFAWWLQPASPRLAMVLQLLAATATFLLGVWLLRRSVPEPARRATPFVDPAWRASLLPLTFVSGVQVLGMHTPLLLLGAIAPAEEAGMYRVAAAISAQVAFATWPINAVYAPHIVKAKLEGRLDRLKAMIRNGRLFGLAIAVPAVLAVIVAGRPGLEWLLGTGYGDAFVPTLILSVGQLLAAAAGPIGPVLSMTGNERLVAKATGVSLAVSLVLGAAFVPWYGATGAAVASAIALATMRSLLARYAARILREDSASRQ